MTAYLANQGVPGIAAPMPTRDGRLSVEHDGHRLSVVPWVSDQRALDGPMTDAHWRAYGEVLAAVHAVPVTDEVRRLLPAGGAAYPSIVAGTRAVAERLRDPDPDDLAGPLAAELAGVWSGMADRVVTLTREVERLAVDQRARPAWRGSSRSARSTTSVTGPARRWTRTPRRPTGIGRRASCGGWCRRSVWSPSPTRRCATLTGGVDRKPRPSAAETTKARSLMRSLPPLTYIAPGALRQDPGCAAESPP
ncbi:hypothetical protein ACQP08_14310 [Micromonospora zamorensis]|uniref:hypothetical protein n=1 Tax=Micromonospora zamorensis TaxID=709883 RepID=UPI003D8C8746